MECEKEIRVDRHRPPRLTFADTDGEPILAYNADVDDDGAPIGWMLHVEHYQPFRMNVPEFSRDSDALVKATQYLEMPLPNACRLQGRSVRLRAEWGGPGENSYFLNATLELDGSMMFSGQHLGPSIGRDGEYEYWHAVPAEDVPLLVRALGGQPGDDPLDTVLQFWSGSSESELFSTLKANGVRVKFSSYY